MARDAAGNTTTSAPVGVVVDNPPPPPAPGLVVALGFEEGSGTTVADASGTGNTGTITGAAWTTSGRYGNALAFDGTNDWVTVADTTTLDLTTAMTLEAWVNPTTLTSWRSILLKERTNHLSYALYANSSTNTPTAHVYIAGDKSARGTTQLPLNTWTHLAATYDGTTLRLYQNGQQTASRAQTGTIATGTGPLRIGGNAIWPEWFNGRIDEIRLYNRALTPTQIQADMSAPVEG